MKGSIKRNRRTIFLGIFACASLVWAAIDQFDVPPRELAELFAYTVAGVLLVILCAALCVLLIVGLGKVLRYLRQRF